MEPIGLTVEQVFQLCSDDSTVWAYLTEFSETHPTAPLTPWVNEETCRAVAAAAQDLGTTYLKPIFEALGGQIPYGKIRLVIAHIGVNTSNARTPTSASPAQP